MPTVPPSVLLLLEEFLEGSFTASELRVFIERWPPGAQLGVSLRDGPISPRDRSHEVVQSLHRNGLLTSEFFEELSRVRPGHAVRIGALAVLAADADIATTPPSSVPPRSDVSSIEFPTPTVDLVRPDPFGEAKRSLSRTLSSVSEGAEPLLMMVLFMLAGPIMMLAFLLVTKLITWAAHS